MLKKKDYEIKIYLEIIIINSYIILILMMKIIH